MTKLQTMFTAILWLVATILVPMAALAPVGGAHAESHAKPPASACVSRVVMAIHACSTKTL